MSTSSETLALPKPGLFRRQPVLQTSLPSQKRRSFLDKALLLPLLNMTVVITIIMIMILTIIIITLIINTTTAIVGIVLLDRIPQSQ